MNIKYLSIGLLALGTASCSGDFLEEKMVSTITQDYFETEQGLDQLVVSTYNAERLRHPYTEGGYGFMNSFMGTQSRQQSGFIINCYPVIDCCNKAIVSIRSGKAVGKYATDGKYAAARLSEALFNRDYLMYTLNTLLGDVYFPQTSITSLPTSMVFMV